MLKLQVACVSLLGFHTGNKILGKLTFYVKACGSYLMKREVKTFQIMNDWNKFSQYCLYITASLILKILGKDAL